MTKKYSICVQHVVCMNVFSDYLYMDYHRLCVIFVHIVFLWIWLLKLLPACTVM